MTEYKRYYIEPFFMGFTVFIKETRSSSIQ